MPDTPHAADDGPQSDPGSPAGLPGRARAAVFFDRDGVINESPGEGYVLSPDDFTLRPGAAQAVAAARAAGRLTVLVTNQRCVGLGLLSGRGLESIHRKMQLELEAAAGVPIDVVYACTADDDDHPERKPHPGMALRAAREHGIDLAGSWMIGDQDKDIRFARAAGLAGVIRVASGKPRQLSADAEVEDMHQAAAELAARLLRR